MNTLIDVRGLGKSYRIKHQQRSAYPTLRDSMAEKVRAFASGESSVAEETFWALRDVDLEIGEGERVGIVGRNGSGKSTLLKLISRITEPSEGRITIRGRVASLLEVGTGFHPELTGRENVFLNGSILGMRKHEIRRRFESIVDFAGVERFLDTPVKRFSSGMYTRLAFAVAAHLDADILLVDEVLAVGDFEFQKKCLSKMEDASASGKTVMFVSHNVAALRRLCNTAVWLDQGQARQVGPIDEVLAGYWGEAEAGGASCHWPGGVANPGVADFSLLAVKLFGAGGSPANEFDATESFDVELEYELLSTLRGCRIGFLVSTAEGCVVFETYDDLRNASSGRAPGRHVSRCRVPGGYLNSGDYVLSVNAGIPGERNLIFRESVLRFTLHHGEASPKTAQQGCVLVDFPWGVRAYD